MEKSSWPVDAYSKWVEEKWVNRQVDSSKCSALVQGAQMLLVEEGTVLEVVCLLGGAGSVHMAQSNACLGVSVVVGKKTVQKFKIRLAGCGGKSSAESCDRAVKTIEKFLPVSRHPSHKGGKNVDRRAVKTLPEMAKELVQGDPEIWAPTGSLLSDFSAMEPILQQCIVATIDPSFPHFLKAVEKFFFPEQQEDEDDI